MAPYTRAARYGPQRISYKEYDSSSGLEDEELRNEEVVSERIPSSSSPKTQPQTTRSSLRRKRLNPPTEKRQTPCPGRSASVNEANLLLDKKKDHENDHPVLRLGGNIPCWQNLPYHILSSIFQYLIHPPCKPTWRAWLVQIALLCRSFVDPALSALYHTLEFPSTKRDAQLLNLLRFQTTASYLNYRGKIKWLVLNFVPRKSRFAHHLGQIFAFTPQLRGIEVVGYLSNSDNNWSQLMTDLESNRIFLHDWIWNVFCEVRDSRESLRWIYPSASLQTIERIQTMQPAHAKWKPQDFATAINELPRLKHLHFSLASSLEPEVLFSLLSVNLESLQLLRCELVSPDTLALFLAMRGRQLRCLYLDGIRPQSNSVLVNLARSCPQLQDLKLEFDLFSDGMSPAEPEDLRSDEIPTWPPSLRLLELQQRGGWTLDSLDMFFSSLVNSADSLPNLRHINIRASLGESAWKSRVRFREKWTRRFLHVFLRTPEPPKPYLQSLRAYQAFKIAQEKSAKNPIAYDPAIAGLSSTTLDKGSDPLIRRDRLKTTREPVVDQNSRLPGNRQSHRLRQHVKDSQRSSLNPSPPVRHRRRRRRRAKGSDSDSSSEDSALADEVEGDSGGDASEMYENLHIQGLCDIVDIVFDNLRPRDEQLRESDFLDEEISGDEDWNGS